MRIVEKARRLVRDFGQYRQVRGFQQTAEARLLHEVDEQLAADGPPRPAPGRSGRRLVMGLAAGYDESDLAPFVRSLRGHGYTGDVALLTFATSPATRQFLESHGVAQISFESLPLLAMSMNSARMLRYLELLRSSFPDARDVTDYDYILLSDVRDVVFQGDPFADVDGADLTCFLETGRTIGTCPINSRWMELGLGREALRLTADEPVSCAGTVIATPGGLLRYLLHMARHILLAPPVARYSGIDQAIHNYIIATKLVGNTRVMANGGTVMTVPADRPHGIVVAAGGMLQNADGSVSPIVHQYDRDPTLKAAVARRWLPL